MDFLKPESKFMEMLGVLADLMLVNLLTLLLCIPIITAGAAFTAMHYVLLKIVREEEGDIMGQFFRAFKLNFRQATIIWVIMIAVYAVMFVDWRIIRMQGDQFPGIVIILLYAAIAFVYLISLYVFPVLSRYKNTIGGTLKTAFAMAVYGVTGFRTILCGIISFVPLILLFLLGYAVVPVFLAFCFSGPGYFRAKLYSSIFTNYESGNVTQVHQEEDEDEKRSEDTDQ
ncbi:MAG: DUF624 domain-containing protein [Solobacterium sp.]|nr:DUF624 domain-containing protein [Solobacterium sp.]